MAEAPAASLFWHDYETFGTDARRDAPVQFAGLRTDLDLRETEEPRMWFCQPPRDRLPAPEAVLVTGILPQQALQQGLREHAFAAAIEAELARPATIAAGFNSIRFDAEVTRFLFWRNLTDPYAHEWRDGCARWDLLDVLRCAWALRPEGLQWPSYPAGHEFAGRPSFRLEHLTAANGIAQVGAHDALVDVRATIALARKLREAQPRLWDFCLRLRSKQAVWDEIGVNRPFVHLSSRYAVERGMLAVVWPLAAHPQNKNELIVWDLAQDPSALASLDPETVRRRLFTRADELPEGEARLPIKTIHVNRSPIVIGKLAVLGDAAQRWGIDLDQAQRHAERAAALPRLDALWRQVFQRPDNGPVDVDEDLYGGFLGDADRRRLNDLRQRPPAALAGRSPAFDDPRLDELFFRYRARNAPESLTDDERARWATHCRERLHEGAAGAVTLAQWQARIDELAEAAMARDDERAQGLLESLLDWGEMLDAEL